MRWLLEYKAAQERNVSMSIETLDDIIEEIMDGLGIYGAHDDDIEMDGDKCGCRCCRSSSLRSRIEDAVDVDRKMRGPILVEASANPPTPQGQNAQSSTSPVA